MKKVLELALREALDLGHTSSARNTSFGLLRQGDGVAVQILVVLTQTLKTFVRMSAR